jgi:DNA processing protein
MNGRDVLLYLSLKYKGDWEKMIQGIHAHEDFDGPTAEEAIKAVSCSYVTIIDPQYPDSFRHCFRPPLVLYYYGNLSLLSDESNCVSYIGSREASAYGLETTRKIVGGLVARGYIIITGLARGIDAEATKAALDNHGKAVGILGSGIDLCYPSSSKALYDQLKSDGLLLSEYPFQTPPDPENFPKRNRMVAAASKGIVVGQAGKRSGTLITVGYALGFTKEVGCVPYHADEESACNVLIKEGAWMVESASDVELMMGRLHEDGDSKNLKR